MKYRILTKDDNKFIIQVKYMFIFWRILREYFSYSDSYGNILKWNSQEEYESYMKNKY